MTGEGTAGSPAGGTRRQRPPDGWPRDLRRREGWREDGQREGWREDWQRQGWWARRGLRTRLVLSSAVPLAVALVVGAVVAGAAFTAGRVADVDRQTAAEAEAVASGLSTGDLPVTLPAPPGSALLAQVLDTDGSVLSATASASRVLPLAAARARGEATVSTDESGAYSGEPLRLRTQPALLSGRPVLIVVGAPFLGVRRTLHALFLVLLLVVPALIALATAVIYGVAGRALRPVERLRAAAAELAGRPEQLVGRPPGPALPRLEGNDELARLSRTLNSMLEALGDVLSRQRRFLADAAHELRSPLASMRVQLDVAGAHPSTTDVASLAAELGPEVERLGHLTDDLLLLARLESRQHVERAPVDLRALARAEGAEVWVLGDQEALRRLVGNLRANAERYAPLVRVRTLADGNWVLLDVDDDGPGIPPEDRDRVFDRWVRLDQSRARSAGGAGLGLSLVREIARAHGGDVEILGSDLGGAKVRVRLPGGGAPRPALPEDVRPG